MPKKMDRGTIDFVAGVMTVEEKGDYVIRAYGSNFVYFGVSDRPVTLKMMRVDGYIIVAGIDDVVYVRSPSGRGKRVDAFPCVISTGYGGAIIVEKDGAMKVMMIDM